jgi:hypothetical protein
MTNSYEVRAMPAQGSTYRWCAGLPWSKATRKVLVVDKSPEITKAYLEGFNDLDEVKVTASQLESLKKDRMIAVSASGEFVAGQEELNEAKAKLSDLEVKMLAERREHQELVEEMKALRSNSTKMLEEQGARIAALEAEAQSLRSQLASANIKKGRG